MDDMFRLKSTPFRAIKWDGTDEAAIQILALLGNGSTQKRIEDSGPVLVVSNNLGGQLFIRYGQWVEVDKFDYARVYTAHHFESTYERVTPQVAHLSQAETDTFQEFARIVADLESRLGVAENDSRQAGERIAELEQDCSNQREKQAELVRLLRNRCDECGSKLIDDCAVCGAPVCCPSCCRVTTMEHTIEAKKATIATLRGLLAQAMPIECCCDLEVNFICEWCSRTRAALAQKEELP
jgi:hypothetical protein